MSLRARAGALGALALGRLLPDSGPAVVNYHSVGVDGGCDNLRPEVFRAHVEWIAERYRIVDLPAVLAADGGDKRVALTFDDALASFHERAMPVLAEHSAPATVFVPAAAVGSGPVSRETLADEHLETPESLMTTAQLRDVAADPLFAVGSHSMTHRNLPAVGDEDALEREVVASRARLETALDTDVDRFAYPFHRYDERVLELVANTYGCAVRNSGRTDRITGETGRHLVPRIAGGVSLPALQVLVTDAGRRLVRGRRAAGNWRWRP